jgi:hypothetical protein
VRIVPASLMPLSNGNFKTASACYFNIEMDDCVYDLEIKEGFEFDGATVPRVFWWIAGYPFQAPRVTAAVMHDWLYTTHVVERSVADKLFYLAMRELGCTKHCADMDYLFVRLFGWIGWNNNTYDDIMSANELGKFSKSLK